MNILLVHSTNSGTTQIVAQTITDALAAAGHSVSQKETLAVDPKEFMTYDLVVLGSPSWDYEGKEGQPHEHYLPLFEKSKGVTADGKSFAIFGLGDKSYTYFTGAVDVLEKYAADLKGKLIVPSLRIDTYYQNLPTNTVAIDKWIKILLGAIGKPQ